MESAEHTCSTYDRIELEMCPWYTDAPALRAKEEQGYVTDIFLDYLQNIVLLTLC